MRVVYGDIWLCEWNESTKTMKQHRVVIGNLIHFMVGSWYKIWVSSLKKFAMLQEVPTKLVDKKIPKIQSHPSDPSSSSSLSGFMSGQAASLREPPDMKVLLDRRIRFMKRNEYNFLMDLLKRSPRMHLISKQMESFNENVFTLCPPPRLPVNGSGSLPPAPSLTKVTSHSSSLTVPTYNTIRK
jgi:hypothetical protein